MKKFIFAFAAFAALTLAACSTKATREAAETEATDSVEVATDTIVADMDTVVTDTIVAE